MGWACLRQMFPTESMQLDDSLKLLMKTRLKAKQTITGPVISEESSGADVWISLHLFVHLSTHSFIHPNDGEVGSTIVNLPRKQS